MTPTPSKENSPPARKRFSLKLWIGVPCALILALVIILSQIDLETVKENFVQRISQETGLKVAMESIGFSFSHGLGLQLKGVKVRSPEGNHFSVERLHLLAEWSPLLKGEFKIKSVTLEHPEATLEIPAPLPKVEEKQKSQPETKLIDPEKIQSAASKVKSTRLSIKKLIVSNGKITLIRAGTAKQVSLSVDGIFVLNRSPGEHLDISADRRNNFCGRRNSIQPDRRQCQNLTEPEIQRFFLGRNAIRPRLFRTQRNFDCADSC